MQFCNGGLAKIKFHCLDLRTCVDFSIKLKVGFSHKKESSFGGFC